MNEHQVGLAESTCSGRRFPPTNATRSGFMDIVQLGQLGLERANTSRSAVRTMGALAEQWGYSDATHLAGVRTKLSGHDDDAKVPLAIIKRTQRQLAKLGAEVALRTEPGAMHGLMQADCPVMGTLVEEGV